MDALSSRVIRRAAGAVSDAPDSWRISAEVGREAALAVAAALDELAGAVSAFETSEAEALWRVEAYPRAPMLDTALEVRLALLAAEAGGRLVRVIEERLAERDWLAENRRAFPPLRIGRFFIHGSHWTGPVPAGAVARRDRRGDGVRHRRASLDARRVCWRSSAGAATPLSPAARYRHRQRRLGDRRGEGAATAGAGERHRLRRGAGRGASRQAQRSGRQGAPVCAPGYRSRAVRPRRITTWCSPTSWRAR